MIPLRRIFLGLAFFPVGIGVYELWELPGTAAAQGAGSGEAWFAAELAAGIATLAVLFCAFAATTLESQDRWLATAMPVLAAVCAAGARALANHGAPAEIYLMDDGKMWILSIAAAIVFGVLAALVWPFGARPKTLT